MTPPPSSRRSLKILRRYILGLAFAFCVTLERASRARLPPAAVDILSFRFSPFGLNKNWPWEFFQKSHYTLPKLS